MPGGGVDSLKLRQTVKSSGRRAHDVEASSPGRIRRPAKQQLGASGESRLGFTDNRRDQPTSPALILGWMGIFATGIGDELS